MATMRIRLRARALADIELAGGDRPLKSVPAADPGFVTLEIETQELKPEETRMLDRLFPHGYRDIERLLASEALLHAIAE